MSRWLIRTCRLLILFCVWLSLGILVWNIGHHQGNDIGTGSSSEFSSGVGVFPSLSVGDAGGGGRFTSSATTRSPGFRPRWQHQHRDPEDVDTILERENPHLPLEFWKETKKNYTSYQKMKNCARLPQIWEIAFNNGHWQMLTVVGDKSSKGSSPSSPTTTNFFLYSAYYDNRPLVKLKPVVRIFGMIDRVNLTTQTLETHCTLWFPGRKQPLIVPVMEYKYIWISKWGNFKNGVLQPYMISCKIPNDFSPQDVPRAVSLVSNPCDTASNLLRVQNNQLSPGEERKDFAVCVKGLDFPHDDLTYRMVEWIELLRLLGVDKVFLYEIHVHPTVSALLEYYVEDGFVDLTPLTLPGRMPNLKGITHLYLKKKINDKRQNELIPYNDCLYRNMYRYKYIVLLDTDEVIMPLQRSTWKELMEEDVLPQAFKEKSVPRASYNVRNVYFLDDATPLQETLEDIPTHMHMLRHIYRAENYTKPGQYVKCFHNADRVLNLHNHFPLHCLERACNSYAINVKDAHLQHYRADCVSTLKKSCEKVFKHNTVMDTTIWRYRRELTERVHNVLTALGLLDR